LYGVANNQVLAGRGSDECIDLVMRAFCRAGQDKVLICPPTFGMYKVAARIQGAGVIEVPLLEDAGFALDRTGVLDRCSPDVKVVFLCSPNNPTANSLDAAEMQSLCEALDGRALVVVDEAYIEFSRAQSFTRLLATHQNLIVMRTLSKAYALAGARCGTLLAHPEIVSLLHRILPPYALPSLTVDAVLRLTANSTTVQTRIEAVLRERIRLADALSKLPVVSRVWPSDANFLLIECTDAERVYRAAMAVGLIIRDMRAQPGLQNCLRVTVGTPDQNKKLVRGIQRAGDGT